MRKPTLLAVVAAAVLAQACADPGNYIKNVTCVPHLIAKREACLCRGARGNGEQACSLPHACCGIRRAVRLLPGQRA